MIFNLTLLLVGTVIAFWISAICGGGASLVLIPILNLILPTSFVPFALTIGTFTSSASRVVVFKKSINWKIFLWFVPFSIPAVLVGAYVIKFINPLYLQVFIGLFLTFNVKMLFSKKEAIKLNEKPYPNYVLSLVGFFAGFVSGITGAIGLLFNRFYLKYGLTKEEIVATRAANEICLHLIKLVIYIALGLFSKAAIYVGLTIALGSIISSLTVKYILSLISDFWFRKIGYGAMAISGFILLFSTSMRVITQDNIFYTTKVFGSSNEIMLNWKTNNITIEFSYEGELEIERSILAKELPEQLLKKYNVMKLEYDEIKLEKTYKFDDTSSFEFYCIKKGKVSKFEF